MTKTFQKKNLRRLLFLFVPIVMTLAHGASRRSVSDTSAAVLTQRTDTHAIFDMKEGCMIGGVRNRKWIAAEKFESSIKGPLKVTLYTLNTNPTDITLKGEEAECHLWWKPQTGGEINAGVAIQAPDWNPLPRTPRAINVRDTTYEKVIADILHGAGIRKPQIKITEGYKIDLDGDGKDEVVLLASRYKNGANELRGGSSELVPGDYALVMVRKVVGNTVRTIFLVKEIVHQTNAGSLARGYHLSAIADMNGDGHMELALYSAYFEGSSTYIFEIDGTKARDVLWCGCEH